MGGAKFVWHPGYILPPSSTEICCVILLRNNHQTETKSKLVCELLEIPAVDGVIASTGRNSPRLHNFTFLLPFSLYLSRRRICDITGSFDTMRKIMCVHSGFGQTLQALSTAHLVLHRKTSFSIQSSGDDLATLSSSHRRHFITKTKSPLATERVELD